MIADELEKSQGHRPPVVVDNTMLGPKYQKPLKQGADLSLLSLTKYVGGHSDLVGGSISGSEALVRQVKSWRGSLGTQARSEFLLDADALAGDARHPHEPRQ
jgi:methionine-gamma-lyase